MEVSGHVLAPIALPLTKESWYPLNRRTGGIPNRSRHFRVEKNMLSLPGVKPCLIPWVSNP